MHFLTDGSIRISVSSELSSRLWRAMVHQSKTDDMFNWLIEYIGPYGTKWLVWFDNIVFTTPSNAVLFKLTFGEECDAE